VVALWLGVMALPLLAAAGLTIGRLRPAIRAAAAWTALPALVFSLWVAPGAYAEIPWLFLGMHLEFTEAGRIFLFFTALVWLFAGIYARGYVPPAEQTRFFLFHLLAMGGNFGLLLAADAPSFYFFFALMTYSGYGLVIHRGDHDALRAGRVYIRMAIMGEMLLFSGVILAITGAENLTLAALRDATAISGNRSVIVALLIGGFAVKAGALPMHMWLPLAHPVAPTPASAVLSATMIKAGLYGWIQFLPLGLTSFAAWGAWGMAGGLAAAWFGIVAGLAQTSPKAILAYSSISQMGLMTVAVGVALSVPDAAHTAILAMAIFALHHGLAKGALFLSVGMVHGRMAAPYRALVMLGMSILVLSMAGVPLSSGAAAKKALKDAIQMVPGPWPEVLIPLLALGSTGTLLLLVRFVVALRAEKPGHAQILPLKMWLPWGGLVLASTFSIWILPWAGMPRLAALSLQVKEIWPALWPALLGGLLAAAYPHLRLRGLSRRLTIPPGDMIVLLAALGMRLQGAARLLASAVQGPTLRWNSLLN
jgi:formate hydrogenlyase subunit 3/multisubunit Na+/H+ antiporter MnhD subunit